LRESNAGERNRRAIDIMPQRMENDDEAILRSAVFCKDFSSDTTGVGAFEVP
jgi:hypothetical protein